MPETKFKGMTIEAGSDDSVLTTAHRLWGIEQSGVLVTTCQEARDLGATLIAAADACESGDDFSKRIAL